MTYGNGEVTDSITEVLINLTAQVRFDQRIRGLYRIIKYMNYGTNGIRFNVQAIDGSVYLLFNQQQIRA